MLHMNNLDLSVFPKMSKDQSILLLQHSNKMAPPEEIWKTVESVWRNMEYASIARGFILAYRIAQQLKTPAQINYSRHNISIRVSVMISWRHMMAFGRK